MDLMILMVFGTKEIFRSYHLVKPGQTMQGQSRRRRSTPTTLTAATLGHHRMMTFKDQELNDPCGQYLQKNIIPGCHTFVNQFMTLADA